MSTDVTKSPADAPPGKSGGPASDIVGTATSNAAARKVLMRVMCSAS